MHEKAVSYFLCLLLGNTQDLFLLINSEEKLFLYNHEIEWIERKPVSHQRESEVVNVPLEEPLKLECQDFIECMKTGKRPKVDGVKGLQVLDILASCQKSLQENGVVVTVGTGVSE